MPKLRVVVGSGLFVMGMTLGAVVIASTAACQSETPSSKAESANVDAAIAPAEGAELDEAAVKAKSHAFFDANDRHDGPAVAAMLGSSFSELEQGWFYDREILLKTLAKWPASPHTRTWKSERVYLGRGTATFIGEAVTRRIVDDAGPPIQFDGWNTVVWVKEDGVFKVAHWQWQKAGLDADRDEWNDQYRRSLGFNHEANRLLQETVKGRAPGAALDVMMGQGRNALYLATQGWKVTGIDISDTGIRVAKESAASKNVTLETVEADIDSWDLGKNRWDLVTMIYAGTDHKLIERIQASLKKGGLIVIEVFHKDATVGVGSGGFETGELAPLFKDGFKILKDEVALDRADWGLEKTKLVRFVAQKI